MEPLKRAIKNEVHGLVGSGRRACGPRPEGLFSQSAVCRRVHGDFTTMLAGGVSALLLQMLHPAALAGVWDHSNFRNDMQGRLRRTAQFMSVTTFGSADDAQRAIARVRSIHGRVSGVLPGGQLYRADDPDLLTWVHMAGAVSFLKGYRRYCEPLSRAQQDRYFAETADIARRLGARNVPDSASVAGKYMHSMIPHLQADRRTQKVRQALLTQDPPKRSLMPFQVLIFASGIELLPDWAVRMHGFEVPALGRHAVRLGTGTAAGLVRWALKSNSRSSA